MNNGKIIALTILIASSFALYLHVKNKLIPSLSIIFEGTNDNTTLGKLAVAFIVLLFVLSFLNEKDGFLLVVTLLMGSLIYSEKYLQKGSK